MKGVSKGLRLLFGVVGMRMVVWHVASIVLNEVGYIYMFFTHTHTRTLSFNFFGTHYVHVLSCSGHSFCSMCLRSHLKIKGYPSNPNHRFLDQFYILSWGHIYTHVYHLTYTFIKCILKDAYDKSFPVFSFPKARRRSGLAMALLLQSLCMMLFYSFMA